MRPSKNLLVMVFAFACLVFIYCYSEVYNMNPAMKIFREKLSWYSNHQNTGSKPVPWWREVMCKSKNHTTEEMEQPLKQLFRDVTPVKDNNVFLLETSCTSNPNYRAWCSVESWARQNPDRDVWFLLTSSTLAKAELPETLLKQYPNLHVITADIDDVFAGTPLEPFYNSRNWTRQDTWPINNLSNMLRVLMLWLFGGVYSDNDLISVQPITLPLNGIGFETRSQLCNAFLSFHAGDPFLLDVMRDISQHFQTKRWGSTGILPVSRVAKNVCKKDLSKLFKQAPVNCPRSLTLYPVKTFYPILWDSLPKLFRPGGRSEFHKIFTSDVFATHMWNNSTKNTFVTLGSQTLYEEIARKYCPFTFRITAAHSDVF